MSLYQTRGRSILWWMEDSLWDAHWLMQKFPFIPIIAFSVVFPQPFLMSSMNRWKGSCLCICGSAGPVATCLKEVMAVYRWCLTSPALLVHHSEALKCQEAKMWICVFSFSHSKPLRGLSWQNWQTTEGTGRNEATKRIHNNSNQVSALCSEVFVQQAFGNISHVQVFRSDIFHQIKTFVMSGLQEWKIVLSTHI